MHLAALPNFNPSESQLCYQPFPFQGSGASYAVPSSPKLCIAKARAALLSSAKAPLSHFSLSKGHLLVSR